MAIETTTDACSAAVIVDDTVYERFEVAPRRHADLILPMVEAVLGEAGIGVHDLSAVAFARGPGAFTGIRVGVAVTQGIAFGAGLPVVSISSLAALAFAHIQHPGVSGVLAAMDARMGEVYWGAYQPVPGEGVGLVGAEQVCNPDAVVFPPQGAWVGVGTGWFAYAPELRARLGGCVTEVIPDALPRARDIGALARFALAKGRGVSADRALPVYLRDRVVTEPR